MALDSLIGKLEENVDFKDRMLKELIDYAFNEDKLLMLSRLNGEQRYYILKAYAVIHFFQEFYNECKATITFTEIKTIPFYKRTVKHTVGALKTKKSFKNFINDILKTTVSEKGKGRDELFDLAKGNLNKENPESRWGRLMRDT